MVDTTYLSYLQIRLAHDIAVLYGIPLNLDDADDVWKLVRLAFGVQVNQAGTGAAMKFVPTVARPVIKRIFSGATLKGVQALPGVGKVLLQRNIIKFGIPVVSVPLTILVNRWTTVIAGRHAKGMLRHEARINEAARRCVSETSEHGALAWTVWLVIQADGRTDKSETQLLHAITTAAQAMGTDEAVFAELSRLVEIDEEHVWRRLTAASGDLAPIYRAAVITAAVDGAVPASELAVLERIAVHCDAAHDPDEVKRLAAQWKA